MEPDRLVCLAKALKYKYRDRGSISVYIFSSYGAAKRYFPFPAVVDFSSVEPLKWARQMHASYFYDVSKGEEYLEVMPLGASQGGIYDTRIDLPVVSKPQCRLELNHRCLVALDEITYPTRAVEAKISGLVTLTGTIARDGLMRDIQLVESNVNPGSGREQLVNEALHNLASWQFASGGHRDTVRITYRYILDPSLTFPGPAVEVALPDQVVIRARSGQ
jgi:hypothetical protein